EHKTLSISWSHYQVAVLAFVALAGCGVNALSGLQFIANPFNFNARCRPDKRSASGNFNV
ncbi:TPA: hypothetical protein ACQ7W6_004707, partial [Escherichia coli]